MNWKWKVLLIWQKSSQLSADLWSPTAPLSVAAVCTVRTILPKTASFFVNQGQAHHWAPNKSGESVILTVAFESGNLWQILTSQIPDFATRNTNSWDSHECLAFVSECRSFYWPRENRKRLCFHLKYLHFRELFEGSKNPTSASGESNMADELVMSSSGNFMQVGRRESHRGRHLPSHNSFIKSRCNLGKTKTENVKRSYKMQTIPN